jgi:spore maturation protein CgeB
MRLLLLGLSLSSSWGNGHATVYRGLLKELARMGVETTFVEKDVHWYRSNRDLPAPPFARLRLYEDSVQLPELLEEESASADVVMLGSYFPDGIRAAEWLGAHHGPLKLYYDIDTPVTLAAFASRGGAEYLRTDQLSVFDAVLSFTGGPALQEMERRWGARNAFAFYCALDPEVHHRADQDPRFLCRMNYMGTFSQDRQTAWERLFLGPALSLPGQQFVLAGPQYPEMELPVNVRHFQHLPPSEHSAFYSSAEVTLNITRAPMVEWGYSPSVRLFEAAGCATCVISDRWQGIEELFSIGDEILVADGTEEMVRLLKGLTADEAREVGERARTRVLRDHSCAVRAGQFLQIVEGL